MENLFEMERCHPGTFQKPTKEEEQLGYREFDRKLAARKQRIAHREEIFQLWKDDMTANGFPPQRETDLSKYEQPRLEGIDQYIRRLAEALPKYQIDTLDLAARERTNSRVHEKNPLVPAKPTHSGSFTLLDKHGRIFLTFLENGINEAYRGIGEHVSLELSSLDFDKKLEKTFPAHASVADDPRHPKNGAFHKPRSEYYKENGLGYGNHHFGVWPQQGHSINSWEEQLGPYCQMKTQDSRGGTQSRLAEKREKAVLEWTREVVPVEVACTEMEREKELAYQQDRLAELSLIKDYLGEYADISTGKLIVEDKKFPTTLEEQQLAYIYQTTYWLKNALQGKRMAISKMRRSRAMKQDILEAKALPASLFFRFRSLHQQRIAKEQNPFLSSKQVKAIENGEPFEFLTRKPETNVLVEKFGKGEAKYCTQVMKEKCVKKRKTGNHSSELNPLKSGKNREPEWWTGHKNVKDGYTPPTTRRRTNGTTMYRELTLESPVLTSQPTAELDQILPSIENDEIISIDSGDDTIDCTTPTKYFELETPICSDAGSRKESIISINSSTAEDSAENIRESMPADNTIRAVENPRCKNVKTLEVKLPACKQVYSALARTSRTLTWWGIKRITQHKTKSKLRKILGSRQLHSVANKGIKNLRVVSKVIKTRKQYLKKGGILVTMKVVRKTYKIQPAKR
ncbi:hypothetical protein B0J14DRAFT_638777 [Halenospora varia]|nr:hypothetical protein B0J14DRAFT_638777 [Halenospora varia]